MNALDLPHVGVKNLRGSMKSMSKKVGVEKPSKPDGFGDKSLSLRLRQEHLICFTRMHAIENLINKIWEPSKAQISALRLLNSHPQMR